MTKNGFGITDWRIGSEETQGLMSKYRGLVKAAKHLVLAPMRSIFDGTFYIEKVRKPQFWEEALSMNPADKLC